MISQWHANLIIILTHNHGSGKKEREIGGGGGEGGLKNECAIIISFLGRVDLVCYAGVHLYLEEFDKGKKKQTWSERVTFINPIPVLKNAQCSALPTLIWALIELEKN